jgi:formylglycine-generating enzyme required for sulfatase activity/tRNA A-37 threonylcarbamoyl transferase component Bud32
MDAVGPYRVVKELGRGAMGVVFEAFDPAIGRTVALKVIRHQEFATAEEDAQLKLRFARECAAAGRLSHPNIVTIYHQGEQDGMQYLVMEYITGTSLQALLAPAVPLNPDSALNILTQIAGALDYAHAEGIVHRDIKPANILVKPDGAVKLTDFGIARIGSQTMTQTGVTVGTPAYMAPEQIMASRVDGLADQFSLAVVAYQMLSGKLPFEAPSYEALVFKIVSGELRPFGEVNSSLPRAVGEVISRGLAKHPGQRYRNCAEFVTALRIAAAPSVPASRQAPPRVPVLPPIVDADGITQALPSPPATPLLRRRWTLIAGGALLAAVAGVWFSSSRTNVGRNPLKPVLQVGATRVNETDGLKYVWIPAGTFQMGCSAGDAECYDSEKPAHEVTIAKGFWIGETPVTQEAYRRVVGKNPSFFKGDQLPVELVNWNEAQSYCQTAGMRLPTEAEWEYAARAGTSGSRYGDLDQIAWYSGNSGNRTHPVGQKQANKFGLYDILGNVAEWVADTYGEYPARRQTDPKAAGGKEHVLRGGSWSSVPRLARASVRDGLGPEDRGDSVGLRCVGN